MNKKYQVFLSSTYEDLQEERRSVMETLLEMDFIPCGMELFPAGDEDQWSLIKKVIDECDYYIVIVAGRYGSIGADGKSYTQMEYEYAVEKGKPTIAFLLKDVGSFPSSKCETTDGGKRKLEDFRTLCQKKMCKMWMHSEDLPSIVNTSLTKLVQNKPAIGWIRTDKIDNFCRKQNAQNMDDILYILDDKPEYSFPSLSKDTSEIHVLARTAVNLLSQYERLFETLGRAGCDIKFIYINPSCEAGKHVYGDNLEIFNQNVAKMKMYLTRLKSKLGDKINAREIDFAPTMSLLFLKKKQDEDSLLVVQLYFMHSRISRDRPHFQLKPKDLWYSAFSEEFEQLWEDATPVNLG